jgi:hypothetical protein
MSDRVPSVLAAILALRQCETYTVLWVLKTSIERGEPNKIHDKNAQRFGVDFGRDRALVNAERNRGECRAATQFIA